ncbi:MAG: hypothetical protein QF554_07440 [Dehalococcoidia bacterium]|nr:hypothetical protein [Dehalococcoidia bacterium]
MRSLTPEGVADAVANRGGMFAGYELWSEHLAVLDWMRFKHAAVEQHISAIYGGIKEYHPELSVGVSSRMPALAPITGHNLRRTRNYSDFQLPKLYWWPGGVAGLRGTAMNWVETLAEWNPGLGVEAASEWFSAAFDIPIPKSYSVPGWGSEAPDGWFESTVDDQVRKMIAAVGDLDDFVPWVGLEHFGSTWITPSELRRMLGVMKRHGVRRYSYFVYNSLTPDYWNVIREFSRG